MKIVVAKVDKRSREGKKTVVNHAGSTITEERIRNFKRRKTVKNSEAMSPSAGELLPFMALTQISSRDLQLRFGQQLRATLPMAPRGLETTQLYQQSKFSKKNCSRKSKTSRRWSRDWKSWGTLQL